MRIDLSSLPKGLPLDQYFGLWAVELTRFQALFSAVARMDLRLHVRRASEAERPLRTAVDTVPSGRGVSGEIAVIDISGPLTKRPASLSDEASTLELRRQIREASNRPDIAGILLRIDSPGGTVAGTSDLALEVRRAARAKPVHAFVEDMTASAAYWIASQADEIHANDRTAMVGSIGTFIGLYDLSGLAEKEGIEAIVIRSGEFKGAGFPGEEVSEAFRSELQTLVDDTQKVFSGAVSRGRRIPMQEVEALADGRIHLAVKARDMGLIDGIRTFDEALAGLSRAARERQDKSAMAAAVTTTASQGGFDVFSRQTEKPPETDKRMVATIGELRGALKGADDSFVLALAEKGATLDEARSAWIEEQDRRLKESEKKAAEAEENAKAQKERPGVEPLGVSSTDKKRNSDGDATSRWNDAVAEKLKEGVSQQRAVSLVVQEDPDLHQAYIEEVNAGRKAIRA